MAKKQTINVQQFREQFKLIEDAAVRIACAIKGHDKSEFTYIDTDTDSDVVEVNFSLGYNCGEEDTDRVDIKYTELEKDINTIVREREEILIRNEKIYDDKLQLLKESREILQAKEREEKDKREYKRLKVKFEIPVPPKDRIIKEGEPPPKPQIY